MIVTEAEVTDWLDRYFEAWYAADEARASELFAMDALYVATPYEKPWPEGERMSGRDQIAEFWQWVTNEQIRILDGGYDLWAVNGNEAYARYWADIELRKEGYWVEAVFTIVDATVPEVIISTPTDGQELQSSTVQVHGEVADQQCR